MMGNICSNKKCELSKAGRERIDIQRPRGGKGKKIIAIVVIVIVVIISLVILFGSNR